MKLVFFILALLFISGCLAKPTNTISECEEKSLTERDNCYFDEAINTNDLGFCTQIIGDEVRNNCINLVS